MRLIGLVAMVVIVLSVLVWFSLKTAKMPLSFHSIYLKIFANYLQLILLTTQLDLSWPSFVLQYIEVQQAAASVDQQVFSFDCYLDSTEGSSDQTYYDKITILAFIPVLLAAVAVAYWSLVYYFKRQKRLLRRELVSTIVILFFLVHPSLVKEYFSIFDCSLLEEERWLDSDLNIQCFTSLHLTYALGVALPSILVWGFGVPTLILSILIKRRARLNDLLMKCRFGFFYNGFKRTHFFWEFLILYRKMFVICLVVFIESESVEVKALSIMVLLLVFLFLQYWQSPYTTSELNQMELRSVLVASITIYCGLYYLTGRLSAVGRVWLFCIMLLVNVYFLHYFLAHFTTSLTISLSRHISILRYCLPMTDQFPEVRIAKDAVSANVYGRVDDNTKIYSLSSLSFEKAEVGRSAEQTAGIAMRYLELRPSIEGLLLQSGKTLNTLSDTSRGSTDRMWGQ
jgi:hypothetical protein